MSLPATLPYGVVSIYGIGSSTGTSGIIPESNMFFGYVDSVSPYGIQFVSPGDSVLFKKSNVTCTLAYANARYTIIEEARLVLKENPPT